jgi:hypothetical protein
MAVRSSRITSPERSESFNKDDSTRRGANVIIDVDGDGLPFLVLHFRQRMLISVDIFRLFMFAKIGGYFS